MLAGVFAVAAPAAAQPNPRAMLEREIHRDGGRLLALCDRATQANLPTDGIGARSRELLAWCEAPDRSAAAPVPNRAESLHALQRDLSYFQRLDALCPRLPALDALRAEMAPRPPAPPGGAQPAAANPPLTDAERTLFTGRVELLRSACSPAGRPNAQVALPLLGLATLEHIATAAPAAPTLTDKARIIRSAQLGLVGGAGSDPATEAVDAVAPTASFVTTALEGLAQFLQSRARAEIQLFVIDRIRHAVCETPAVRLFLPATCTFLGRGDDFFAASFGTAFVAAVNDDALHLPAHFGDYIDETPDTFPGTGGLLLRAGLALTSSLGERVDLTAQATDVQQVVDAWNCVAGDTACGEWKSALHFGLVALAGVSRFSPGTSDDRRDDLFRVLTALAEIDHRTLDRGRFDDLVARVERLRTLTEQYNTAATASAREALVEPITAAVVALVNESIDLADGQRQYPRIPGSVAGLFGAVARRAVGDVLAGASRVTLDLLHAAQRTGHTTIADSAVSVPGEALRVLAFGADLGAARTPEQVSAAIDSFAAPVGSWRVKARNSFTLSLGGAFGIAGGQEWAHSGGTPANPIAARSGGFGAIFAPVGLDVSFGVGPVHLGLLLPIVDLGAFVPLSAARDDARNLNPLSFLAPGAMIRVGFAGLPIIVGGGVSYHPFAYAVAPTSGGSSVENPSVTFSGFVAVDIPIFTFASVAR